MTGTVENLDIWRTARLLIREYRVNVLSVAAGCAADLAVQGDREGAMALKRIVDALRELERKDHRERESLN